MKPTSVAGIFPGRYLFHALVWLVYGVYNLMNIQGYVTRKGWLFALPPLFISLALVAMLIYVNAFLLVPRLLDRRKIGLYIISVLSLVSINTCLRSLCQQHWDNLAWPKELMELSSYFKWALFDGFWSILISTLLLFSLRWSEQRQQVKNIEVAQLQTELKYLRSQLNPHFLFNGLNTIYGNIDMKNEEARDILVRFSELLRYYLYEADTDLIDLGKETTYIENYVALQKARNEKNLRVDMSIAIENPECKIAPLLFIPFVENAFKFVSREEDKENKIDIRLLQKDNTVAKDNTVSFECVNTFEKTEEGGGIGLKNVQRRLELLYKGRYNLSIQKEDRLFHVQLTLHV